MYAKKEECIVYKGLKIYPEEGEVYSPSGRELGHGKPKVQLISERGTKLSILKLRLVYEAVHGPIEYGSVVVPKDGDPTNGKISNALYMTRTEYFKGHDWSIKLKVDKERAKQIREKYLTGRSYRTLAEEYDVSTSTILKIVKGTYFKDEKDMEDLTTHWNNN